MASLQQFTVTIPSSGTDSDRIPQNALRNARALSIQAPAALTGTVNVVSGSNDTDAATFTIIQSPPGTDVTCAPDKTTVLLATPFPTIKLRSTIAEAAARTFVICVQIGE